MGKRKREKGKKGSRSLVIHRLENVSKLVFKKHYNLITELIGSSPGVYALYDDRDLYYVGKSTDLRKRVRHHLRDRHYASWTHFSLYLVRRAVHISEIEALIVRVANPKGNRAIPKGKSSTIFKKLKAMVKQKQQLELEEMFGIRKPRPKRRRSTLHSEVLKGLVTMRKRLYKTYKGKEYKAILTPGGTIILGKKRYKTPTAAAKAVVKRHTVNGWTFWFIKDSNGDWVRLCDFKG